MGTPASLRPRAMSRRRFVGAMGALAGAAALPAAGEPPGEPIRRAIPSSGELVPAIGVGTWITFNAGSAPAAREPLVPVMRTFLDRGGTVIDSSPMYGSSEEVIGWLLRRTGARRPFAATKVWTHGRAAGERQLELSLRLWGVAKFDLVQVHNLLDWETHLATLEAWKAAGRLRYIGITTSHGRRHDELERALRKSRFDFVQFTYGIHDRTPEERLLPLAAERGIAVIANRPFDGGTLFDTVAGKPLPAFARDLDCVNWAQFFLKFIVSHPAVTCAIPATSKAAHMAENMGALYGRLPDARERRRMAEALP